MTSRADAIRCRRCGEIIGAYEPVYVLGDAHATLTSRTADPELCSQGPCLHSDCYLESLGADTLEPPATSCAQDR